jgi:hypothetical protein
MASLVERGVLEVEQRATRVKPTVYRMPGVAAFWDAKMATEAGSVADRSPLTRHSVATVVRESSDELELELEESLYTRGDTKEGEELRLEAERGKGKSYRFDDVWKLYPARNGRRVDKELALKQWLLLSYADKSRVFAAVRTYAAERPELPPDMHRWLRRRTWEDYLVPLAVVDGSLPARRSVDYSEMSETEWQAAYRRMPEADRVAAEEQRRAGLAWRAEQSAVK